jgi:outer membrane protein
MHSLHSFRSTFQAQLARTATASAFTLGLCVSLPSVAAEPAAKTQPTESSESSSWGLGIGMISAQKPYAGIDRDNTALPLIYFENKYVRVFGPGAEVKLPALNISSSQRIGFSILGRYDGSGYKPDDAPILNGMSKRESGFWAGAGMTWHNDVVNVSADWFADASGNSKGQSFSLGLEKTWRFGEHVMLTPRLKAKWLDKKYVDYYYGVRADEVRADRSAYVGESAVNSELGIRANYIFDAQHSVFMDVGVTRLAKEIKNSPLVDRSNENRVMLGYMYRF